MAKKNFYAYYLTNGNKKGIVNEWKKCSEIVSKLVLYSKLQNRRKEKWEKLAK